MIRGYIMLNFQPIYLVGLDCLENCFVNILKFYQYDYHLLFYKFYYFAFRKKCEQYKSIGERISIGKKIHPDTLFAFYNLKANYQFDIYGSHHMLQENTSSPVILFTDAYFCRWMHEYKKKHHSHFIILLNKEGNEFTCLDPMANIDTLYTLPYDDYLQGFQKVVSFENESTPLHDYQNIFSNTIRSIKLEQLSISYNALYSAFENLDSLNENDIGGYTQIDSILGHYLAGRRYLFSKYIDLIYKKTNLPLSYIVSQYKQLSNKWIILRNIILKAKIMHAFLQDKSKILKLLNDIITHEIHLLKSLKALNIKEKPYHVE